MKTTSICRVIRFLSPFLAAVTTFGDTATNFPVADTTIRNDQPDANFGTATQLPVGISSLGTQRHRALFRFDVSNIPSNATVTSTKVLFTSVQNNFTAVNYDLFRLLKSWGEGTNNGLTAVAGECSWNDRLQGTASWGSGGALAGSDYASVASASAIIDGPSSIAEFTSATLTSNVLDWISNPATNFGWILIATGEPNGSGKRVGSRENPGLEPRLVINFDLPAAPNPPVINNPTLSGGQFIFSFAAETNQAYNVETSLALAPPNWTVLTNYPGQPSPTVISVTNPVVGSGSYFRIRFP